MMDCRQIRRSVDDVASHRATLIEESHVREHARSCASCQDALAEAEAYAALLGCVPPTRSLDEGFTRATVDRIDASGLRPSYWHGLRDRLTMPAVGGAALAAAACVALILAAPGGFHRSAGTGAAIAVESSPAVVASASVGDMKGLRRLDMTPAPDEDLDPFADGAVTELSRAGASHYMLTGLGL